jgi:hypothetical protein
VAISCDVSQPRRAALAAIVAAADRSQPFEGNGTLQRRRTRLGNGPRYPTWREP